MTKLTPHDEDLFNDLKDPESAFYFIKAYIEDMVFKDPIPYCMQVALKTWLDDKIKFDFSSKDKFVNAETLKKANKIQHDIAHLQDAMKFMTVPNDKKVSIQANFSPRCEMTELPRGDEINARILGHIRNIINDEIHRLQKEFDEL